MNPSELNSTLNALNSIDLNKSHHSKEADLLAVKTVNQQQVLVTIKRADLGFFGRLWTWMGFGSASLKNVSRFLSSSEGQKQLEGIKTQQAAKKALENLELLNSRKLTAQAAGCHLLRVWTARSVLLNLSPFYQFDLEQIKTEKEKLEKQILQLSTERTDLNNKVIQLQSEVKQTSDTLSNLKTTASSSAEQTAKEIYSLKNNYENLTRLNHDTNGKLSNANVTIQQLQGNLNHATNSLKAEIKKTQDLQKTVDTLQKNAKALQDKSDEQYRQILNRNDDIAALEHKNNQLQLEIQERPQMGISYHFELNQLKQELEDKTKELNALTIQFQQLSGAQNKKEAEKSAAETEYKKAQEVLLQKDKKLLDLQVELQKIENEKNSALKAKEEVEKQKDHAREQWNIAYQAWEKSEKAVAEQKDKITQALKEKDQALDDLRKVQLDYQTLKKMAQELSSEHATLTKEKGELTLKLAQVDAKLIEINRQQRNTQQNLDDQLRDYITKQMSLPDDKVSAQLIQKLIGVTEAVLNPKDGESKVTSLDQLVTNVRSEMNNLAIKELCIDMEKDNTIDPEVCKALQMEWHKPDGGVFGSDIKNNSAFLTVQRRQAILEKAREITRERLNRDEAIGKFQIQIADDIKKGRFVPASTKQMRERYAEYFNLVEKSKGNLSTEDKRQVEIALKNEVTRICNAALVSKEIKRKSKQTKASSLVEKNVLKALGYTNLDQEDTKDKLKQAELAVLNILLAEKGLEEDSIEVIRTKMRQMERRARLEACLKADHKEHLDNLIFIISYLEKEFLAVRAECDKNNKTSLQTEDFKVLPEKARKLLLKWKANIVDSRNKSLLKDTLLSHKDALQRQLKAQQNNIKNMMDLIIDEMTGKIYSGEIYQADANAQINPHVQFYKKWGSYLDAEMIQGVDDEQEILTKGTCFALSTQLSIEEQNRDFDSINSGGKGNSVKKSVGAILSVDRYRQALLGVNFKMKQGSLTEKMFPKAMLKSLKLNSADPIYDKNDPDISKGEFETAIKSISKELESSNGVAFTVFYMKSGGGHAIFVRRDEKNKIYRLFDPNVGYFTFTTENQLFYCFKDLIETSYGTLTQLLFHRLNPAKGPTPTKK